MHLPSMDVRDLYQPGIVKIEGRDSLFEAATRMRFHQIGALVVYEDAAPAGIVTEQDLTDAIVDRVDPARTAVFDYMSPGPVSIPASAPVADAAAVMTRLGTRHLLVTDGGGFIGMISARDVLVALSQKKLHLRTG